MSEPERSVFRPPPRRGALIFLAGLGLMLLRSPGLILQPRFWGEEGSVYFVFACGRSWWEVLASPHQGYYSLWANGASLLARLLPLERAPLAPMLVALAAQCVPLAVLAWGGLRLWRSVGQRAAAAALVVLIPGAERVWLSSINSQYYLALAVMLVLVSDDEGRSWAARLVLGAAGLAGPAGAALAPVFFFRAWRSRRREAWLRAGLLGICALVQAAALLSGRGRFSLAGRFALEPALLGFGLALKSGVVLLAGSDALLEVSGWARRLRLAEPGWFVAAGVALLALEGTVVAWLVRRLPRGERAYLPGALLSLGVVVILFGLGDQRSMLVPRIGQRYFFLLNLVFLLLVLAAAFPAGRRRPSVVPAVILAVVLALGAGTFWSSMDRFSACPDWSREVAAWRAGHQDEVGIWPAGWSLKPPLACYHRATPLEAGSPETPEPIKPGRKGTQWLIQGVPAVRGDRENIIDPARSDPGHRTPVPTPDG